MHLSKFIGRETEFSTGIKMNALIPINAVIEICRFLDDDPHTRKKFLKTRVAEAYRTSITVTVWYPKERLCSNPWGHAALRTYSGSRKLSLPKACYYKGYGASGYYASYYPATKETPLELRNIDFDDTNYEDIIYQKIEHHLDVGHENIKKINRTFEKFVLDPHSWNRWGSMRFRLSYERNCSGLVLYLLESGGIRSSMQERANTVFHRTLFISGAFLITACAGGLAYSFLNKWNNADQVSKDLKAAASLSKTLNTGASTIIKLFPNPTTSVHQANVNAIEFLIEQSIKTLEAQVPKTEGLVTSSKNYLHSGMTAATAVGSITLVAGYKIAREMANLATPASVDAVIREKNDRRGKKVMGTKKLAILAGLCFTGLTHILFKIFQKNIGQKEV